MIQQAEYERFKGELIRPFDLWSCRNEKESKCFLLLRCTSQVVLYTLTGIKTHGSHPYVLALLMMSPMSMHHTRKTIKKHLFMCHPNISNDLILATRLHHKSLCIKASLCPSVGWISPHRIFLPFVKVWLYLVKCVQHRLKSDGCIKLI